MRNILVSHIEKSYILKKLKSQNRLLENWGLHNKQGRGMRLYDNNKLIIEHLEDGLEFPKDSFLIEIALLQNEIVKHKNILNQTK